MALWAMLALLAHLALIDAAVETFWSGSPLRYWVSPALVLLAALSLWLWRPGGRLLRRFGPSAAAATPVLALLAVLAVTVWLPGGQDAGVRMLLQSTSRLLTAVLGLAVLLAAVVLVQAAGALPSMPRLAARLAVLVFAVYGLAALWIAFRGGLPFAALLQGGALWQRLPRWLQGSFVGVATLLPIALLLQVARIPGSLRRERPVQAMAHQATALVMALIMATAGLVLPRPEVGPGPSPTAAGLDLPRVVPPIVPVTSPESPARLARMLRAAEGAEKEIPGDSFDPNAIVAKIGQDPDKLFAWVRDNTDWVPYRGALRGPRGVLMDRVGNSLDRSLLLAELLLAAGCTVRLAHATLPDSQASALLRKVRLDPVSRLPVGPPVSESDLLRESERIGGAYQLSPAELREGFEAASASGRKFYTELRRRAAEETRLLAQALGRPNGREDTGSAAMSALIDHWWVQRGDAERWIDLDPLLPDARPSETHIAAGETFPATSSTGIDFLPSRYCHEVTIRVVVEQWAGGIVREKIALTHSFRSAAAIAETIVFDNAPLAWQNPQASDGKTYVDALRQGMLDQSKWLPRLMVGSKTFSHMAFTDSGNLEQPQLGGATQGLGATGGMGSLFGGLSGAESPDDSKGAGVLTAEWLEYEIRVPGSKPRTVRRELFDLIGPQVRGEKPVRDPENAGAIGSRRALSVLHTVQILPLACRLSAPFVGRQLLREFLANREALSGYVDAMAAGDRDRGHERAQKIRPSFNRLYALALARFEGNPRGEDSYLDGPNLVSYHAGFTQDGSGTLSTLEGFDIVVNDVAARPGVKADPFDVRVAQGAADTNAEGLLEGTDAAANAGVLSNEGEARGGELIVVRSRNDRAFDAAPWPAEVGARVGQDLDAGYVVVLPRRATIGQAPNQWAWWRVDPRTGQTLGMGPRGWGQSTTEKAISVAAIAIAVGLISFVVCDARMEAKRGFPAFTNSQEEMDARRNKRDQDTAACVCGALASGAAAGAFAVGAFFPAVGATALWLGGAFTLANVGKETFCPTVGA